MYSLSDFAKTGIFEVTQQGPQQKFGYECCLSHCNVQKRLNLFFKFGKCDKILGPTDNHDICSKIKVLSLKE